MTDRSGQRIDHYHLVQRLGEGGFGEVYLAEDVYHARSHVAIKILPRLADSDIAAFLNEARTIRLKHPHIVQVQDFGIDNHTPFIVMDYAPHGTLRQRHPKGTRLLLDIIVSYVHQIADALEYAHNERVVHRDVKPENLLVGTRNEILVSDFGIATIASTSRSQSVLEMAGTIAYMAPEQIQGRPHFASDQYALAIIVYEWLCGERPFIGAPMEIATQHMLKPPPSLCDKVPNLSHQVEKVILTALAKDAKDRFSSILAFASALEQTCREQIQRQQLRSSVVVPVILPVVSQEKSLPAAITENLGIAARENVIAPITKVIPMPSSAYVPASSMPVQRRGFANPGPPLFPNGNAVPHPARKASKVSHPLYRVAILLVVLVVALLGSGAYAVLRIRGNIVDVDGTLSSATSSMQQARGDVSTNHAGNALQRLATVRDDLLRVQGSGALSDTQHARFDSLKGNFVRTVQQAAAIYNHQYQIVSLPCDSTITTAINSGSTLLQARNLAVLQGGTGKPPLTYILADDKNLYPLAPQGTLGNKFQFPASTSQVETIASDGTRLVALFSTPGQGQALSYGLSLLLPQQDGTLREANSTILNIPTGYTPNFVTIVNTTVSVVLVQQVSSTQPKIMNYTLSGTGMGQHFNTTPPTNAMISISKNIVDVIAASMGQGTYLFFLLSDGSIQSLTLADGNNASSSLTNVQLTTPIAAPLALNASFTLSAQTPISMPASASITTLSVPGATLLATGSEQGENGHFYVVAIGENGVGPRILDLKVTAEPASSRSATPGTVGGGIATQSASLYMTLVQQYALDSSLSNAKGVAVDPKGNGFYLLTQNGQSKATPQFVAVNLPLQKTCIP